MTVTDQAHVAAAAVLRRAYQQRGQVPFVSLAAWAVARTVGLALATPILSTRLLGRS